VCGKKFENSLFFGGKSFLWKNEMVQGPCARLQLHDRPPTVVVDRLNAIIDRLNVISSGSVIYMKIDAKVCFQGDHLVAIFEHR
jgi:hypothetical protein